MFELIDETTYNDPRAIKDIRNKFAHTINYVFFTSEQVARECQRLTGWVKDGNDRILFEKRCIACVELMKASINRHIWAHTLKDEPPPLA